MLALSCLSTRLSPDGAHLWTAMAPEGTRSYVPGLKSGYYHLAKTADIPILAVGPHFKDKTMNILPLRKVMQTFELDAQNLTRFARTMVAKDPDLAV